MMAVSGMDIHMAVRTRFYGTLADMPPRTREAVRTMGHAPWGSMGGILRSVAADCNHYRLDGSIVLYEDGVPVGWAALYSYWDRWSKCRKSEVGFWVRHKYRKKGYGLRLIRQAHNRWYSPTQKVSAFNNAKPIWEALDIMKRINRKSNKS